MIRDNGRLISKRWYLHSKVYDYGYDSTPMQCRREYRDFQRELNQWYRRHGEWNHVHDTSARATHTIGAELVPKGAAQ